MLTETAYAKVNLALHVRRRREDGYHDLESLFVFVEGGDALRAEPRTDGELRLTIDGLFSEGLDSGPDNLVIRAAKALQLAVCPEHGRGTVSQPLPMRRSTSGGNAQRFGTNLHLTKNLPVASGIGGGSADAAAALRLLNRLWDCGLDDRQLCAIAETLGSDIPACVISRTLRVEGRGEALEPLELPGLSGIPILLVNPGIPLGTAPVFRGWDQRDLGPLDTSSLDAIIRQGRNDLEAPARALVPQIGYVLDRLTALPGVMLSRMSGSGATCFALFDSQQACNTAQTTLASEQPGWWIMSGFLR